jgi:hypothetical protein
VFQKGEQQSVFLAKWLDIVKHVMELVVHESGNVLMGHETNKPSKKLNPKGSL